MTIAYFIITGILIFSIPVFMAIYKSRENEELDSEDILCIVGISAICFAWPLIIALIIPCLIIYLIWKGIYDLTLHIYENN